MIRPTHTLLFPSVLAATALSAQTFTTLFSFNKMDGESPMAPLVQGLDGNLYGTTLVGGGHGQGSIFRIGTSGAFATVYSFCAVANCADGFNPEAGLVLSESGDLYGTTTDLFYGKIFKITPSGTLTVLHDFRSDGVYVRMVASPTGSFAPPMGISGEPRKGAEPPNTARSSRSARMVT